MKTAMDKAGRVVIPRPIRKQARLRAGMELNLEFHHGKIEIEPVRRQVRVARRGSRLVLAAPAGASVLTTQEVNRILEGGS